MRMLPLLVSLVLASAGCRAKPPAAQSDGSAAQPPTLTSAGAPESPTVKARMRGHEVRGVAIRDATARADLATTKREAMALAELRIEEPLDPAWRKRLDAMNGAAADLAKATDLTQASRDLAALARTCGDCHATMGRPGPIVEEPPAEASGVAPRMRRHQWAANELWDGLVVPSDDAWKAGARVLSDAPLEPEALTPGKTPVPAVGKLASSVHDLGRKASAADSSADRVALFGELMTTCSACHGWLGGGPATPRRSGR